MVQSIIQPKDKKKIGKSFLNLSDKYFLPHNKLRRFFNQTNVKTSYSCMPYIEFLYAQS